MKKCYKKPGLRFIDLDTEGMIAESIKLGGANQTINTEDAYSQKQEQDLWGNEDIWK